jgi:rod shape determining protein RodA
MLSINVIKQRFQTRDSGTQYRTLWQCLHIDIALLFSILLLMGLGLFILYSASNKDTFVVEQQLIHIGLALMVMLFFAQISPTTYQRWAPWLYLFGILLLIAVMIMGRSGKGAQRWLKIGFFRLQPSEIMKLAIPMLLAWHFQKIHLPLYLRTVGLAALLILIPAVLTAKQPDLGTAILLVVAGATTLFLAGLSTWILVTLSGLMAVTAPILWHFMHDYQRQRVLTFLNPERDPLGAGYHIIQSKIAIGSGGLFGKGWLNGTQSHLHFLPEHATDFIFAACGEEFGLIGSIILITLFMIVVIRCLFITINAQDTFTRLLAGSLTITFFVFCQYGYGYWYITCCRNTIAVGELRWLINGDLDGKFRYPDVHSNPPQIINHIIKSKKK